MTVFASGRLIRARSPTDALPHRFLLMKTASHALSPIKPVGRPKVQKQPMGRSATVVLAIQYMVRDGLSRKQAAEKAGIKDDTLYKAFLNPEVRREYEAQIDVLRTSERARNIHKAAQLRDEAESEKVQLDSAKWLHGEDKQGGVTVNVGVNVQPGYVIGATEHVPQDLSAILQKAGSTRNVLNIQAERSDDE